MNMQTLEDKTDSQVIRKLHVTVYTKKSTLKHGDEDKHDQSVKDIRRLPYFPAQ